jgi:anti-sigma B factor antagonist
VATHEGPRILALEGELDLLREAALRKKLAELAGAAAAIVDLTAVAYLDSMALAAFVKVNKEFARREARIVWVVPPGSNARRIFELANLDRYFALAADLAAARQALSAV